MNFSIIIPVYNRPIELNELLESLTKQTDKYFEVVIVDDGSSWFYYAYETVIACKKYSLNITLHYKSNSGPGLSRNYGCEKAKGDYFIFLDADTIVPENYMETVRKELINNYVDCFGGVDKAHESFTPIQKAINYAMTSFLTTGGIRNSEKIDRFYPRSFNMGFSKEVFDVTGGFSNMRYGEDIDMSIRIIKCGFHTRLIKEAFVYHKRRSTLKEFFMQAYHSGQARVDLYLKHKS